MTPFCNCAGGYYSGVVSRFWTGGVLVSFIGSLDQFDLSIILQRIESYKKTGLLVVKQGERSVELSFRHGQLLCIGPIRPDISLGERLLQAGVISREAYQEVVKALGVEHYREVGAALSLIDQGHVNQESLYRWAFTEAAHVIEALIAWTDGEVYFEENQQPPSDRLLIALSISSLLPEQPSEAPAQPVTVGAAPTSGVAQQHTPISTTSVKKSSIADIPTMHGEEPAFFDDASFSTSLFSSPGPMLDTERNTDTLTKSTLGTLLPPQPVITPVAPMQINTAYMQPQMVLTPVDLSTYREQNPQMTFTPDQWRLFTRADGQTTLQTAIQELGMSRDQVCQAAGELVALGVITLSSSAYGYGDVNEMSPAAREHAQVGLSNGMMTPGYAASPAFDAVQPSPDPQGRFSPPHPIETQSQWGNGGNGATFVLGNGWVVAPPDVQPQPMNQYEPVNRVYAKAG
ncbi:MAG: DUF4388 domain-containing protein [Ktedonobacteraceae bacterium]